MYPTWKKVLVSSAGISVHFFNMLIGIFLTSLGIKNIILTVWIIANIGMAITNLMFLGPTDGYFIFTSLIGVYNFRYRGYKALHRFLYGHGKIINSLEGFYGFLLVSLWSLSFFGIYKSAMYYSLIFGINSFYTIVLSIVIISLLLIRFLLKIKNVK